MQMNRKAASALRRAVVGAATILTPGILATGPALAQDEDIIVTAQKREQALIDVPAAITAIDGKMVKDLNIADLSAVAAQVPGFNVTFERGENTPPSFNLRGIEGDALSARLNESSIAIYTNDVFVGDESNLNAQLFDVQRVEVLRGPQGTLFGKNTTGGLVHFISATPTPELSGYASIAYGQDNAWTLEGAVSGPLSDRVRLRLAAKWDFNDGHYDNIFVNAGQNSTLAGGSGRIDKKLGDRNLWGVRGTIDVDLSEDTLLRVIGNYTKNNSHSTTPTFIGALLPGTTGPGPYTRAQMCPQKRILAGECISEDQARFGYPPLPERRAGIGNTAFPNNRLLAGGESYGITARITHDFDWATLTSVTNYSDNKYLEQLEGGRATPGVRLPAQVPDIIVYRYSESDQLSQELRLNGSSKALDWVVGAFYYKDHKYNRQDFLRNNLAVQTVLAGVNSSSYALFGQIDGHLSDQFTLSIGGRYTDEKRRLVDARVLSLGNLVQNVLAGAPEPRPHTRDFTGKFGLAWEPSDDQTYYAGYSRGIKGVGFNNGFSAANSLTANIAILGPVGQEVLDSFEFGAKHRFFDRRLSINTALFYYLYKGKQTGLTVWNGFTPSFNYINAGQARLYGIETEISFQPSASWDFRFSGSLIKTKITDSDVVTSDAFNNQVPLEGLELVKTPKWTFNAIAAYHIPTSLGRFTLQTEVNGRDKQHFSLANDPLAIEPSHVFANFRIMWRSPDERFNAQAFLTNAFNEAYFVALREVVARTNGLLPAVEGQGRLWGVKLGMNF
jgi:iron complex outermembrane receptor protein